MGNVSQSYVASPAIWNTQCYLPPDTGEAPHHNLSQTRLVLNLPNPEGRNAELTLVIMVIYRDGLPVLSLQSPIQSTRSNHFIVARLGVEPTTSA